MTYLTSCEIPSSFSPKSGWCANRCSRRMKIISKCSRCISKSHPESLYGTETGRIHSRFGICRPDNNTYALAWNSHKYKEKLQERHITLALLMISASGSRTARKGTTLNIGFNLRAVRSARSLLRNASRTWKQGSWNKVAGQSH